MSAVKTLPPALLQKIQEHKAELAGYVRSAIIAKLAEWDADGDIERLLDVEVCICDDLEAIAAGCDDAGSVARLDEDDLIKLVTDNINTLGESYDAEAKEGGDGAVTPYRVGA